MKFCPIYKNKNKNKKSATYYRPYIPNLIKMSNHDMGTFTII